MPRLHLMTLVYFAVAILAILLMLEGKHPIVGSMFKPCSTIVTVMGVALLIFDKWVWRWRLLHPWFVSRPVIKGTWKGQLQSEYVDPATGIRVPPIEVYLAISQTYFTITLRLITRESVSETIATEVRKSEDGVYTVASIYRNTPDLDHRVRSPIHHGAMLIWVEGNPKTRLRAEYWTDRLTRGKIVLELRSATIFNDFESAISAEY